MTGSLTILAHVNEVKSWRSIELVDFVSCPSPTAHECTHETRALESCKKPDRYQHVTYWPETMVGNKSGAEQREEQ